MLTYEHHRINQDTKSVVLLTDYSPCVKHPFIILTTSTVFVHFIHSLYFCCMFRCHIHRHQGELLCCLLKTRYCYEVMWIYV